MNVSYEWLTSLVDAELSPEQVRDVITARCCPVDELVALREDLKDVVIGLVVEAARHPDSDHLSVTRVDAGVGELLEVVCGAPNVRAGKKYPFAPAGSTLPGGLKLERRKIRGVTSNGMLCSARELALGEEHDGILELDTDAAPGTPFLAAVAVGDVRIVIDVTPNRPDLLSHLGVARELGAATGARVRLPDLTSGARVTVRGAVQHPREGSAGAIRVELDDAAGCPRYCGVMVRGVRVGPSPAWLAQRLTAIGSRPINNVVDVTNYLLHEVGQPMHAFDAVTLGGSAVVIRRARAGERLRTLDGVDRTLDPSMTVIADGERAQAVAGVIGGAESEVTESTRDIFLEVAHFDPAAVRRTRRMLGLSTDASYRFERGTDIELPPKALARAAALLIAVAGGEIDGTPVDLYPKPRPTRLITLRVPRVARVLGESIPAREITGLLLPIGFDVAEGDGATLTITVPTWRPDIVREVDIIEEVARLRGYESFSTDIRPFRPGTVPDSPVELLSRRVRETLVAEGLLETRPMPFVPGAAEGYARVANPLAENEAYLRRALLETLGRRVEYNFALAHRDVRLFEIGAAFEPAGAALPREELRAAAVITGHRRPPHWTESRPPDFDEWDAKGLAETLARAAHPTATRELRGGSGASIWEIVIDGRVRGEVRRLSLDAPVWAAPVFGVEIALVPIESSMVAAPGEARHGTVADAVKAAPVVYRAIPATPPAFFDLALLVPNDMHAASVERVMRQASGELLERLDLLSEYRGDQIPEGMRSVAWRLTFRHPERTLREKEIAGRREKVVRTLEGELGVRQRTT